MYTRIDALIWTDDKFKQLSYDGKILFFYTLTNSHRNMVGIYHLPGPYGSYDLGWDIKRYDKGLEELLKKGLVEYNFDTSMIFIPNFLKYNPLENQNQVKGAIKALSTIPTNGLNANLLKSLETLNKPFLKPLIELLQQRLGEQESEEVAETVEVEEDIEPPRCKKFIPPTIDEVQLYCTERGNSVNPQKFLDYYTSNGWMRGRTKIRDWKACVRTWESNEKTQPDNRRWEGVLK